MLLVDAMARCPACRARLEAAEVCSRCGTDFSMVRRAERQAQALTRLAVQQWAVGQTSQARATANAACALAASPLAQAMAQMASQPTLADAPQHAEPSAAPVAEILDDLWP